MQKPIELENIDYIVYHITSPLSKSAGYVGISKKSAEDRLDKHFSHAMEDKKAYDSGKLHRIRTVLKALLKYGRDNINIAVIDNCIGLSRAGELEKRHIARLDTFKHGWNETEGGEGQPAYTPDCATREKISKANSGRRRTLEAVEANRARSRERADLLNNLPPRSCKSCVVDGIQFKAIKDVGEHFSVSYGYAQIMAKKGTSDIFDDKSVEVYGVKYRTRAEALNKLGWVKQNYYNYLLFGSPKRPKGATPEFLVGGKRFTSFPQIAKEFNCSLGRAMYLAATGGDTAPAQPIKPVTVDGVLYESKKSACEVLDISKTQLEIILSGNVPKRLWAKYEYCGKYFSTLSGFKRVTGLSKWYFDEYLNTGEIKDILALKIRYNINTGEKI